MPVTCSTASPGVVWDPPRRQVRWEEHNLADRLYAARPVTWRGRGDLLQIPDMAAPKGTWLVLDLWAGVSGLLVAAISVGMHCYAITAESDPGAAACSVACFPNAVVVEHVEDIHATDLVPFLERRAIRGIVAGGGSPCQGNSSLNNDRQGLQDERSLQPMELFRIRAELEALPQCKHLELVFFLENVASMPKEVRLQYSMWMQSEPVFSDAATCGWCQRRRLYWLTGRSRGLSPACGPKPIPGQVTFLQGFRPLFDAKQVVTAGGQRAMRPFTREFYHPTDRVAQSSPEAAERFFQDKRRFAPSSYEENSLLWKQEVWRQPLPEERCQMMGLPFACVAAVQGDQATRRAKQNSLVGNGFHIPTIMALLYA